VHVSKRCSVYDGRAVLMSRRFDRRASPSTEPENNALQQIFNDGTVNRGRRRCLLYSAPTVLVL
jgi:hypothetical protein